MQKAISSAQMKRLQVLYSRLARHTDQSLDRTARMAWASQLVQRPIASFHELTMDEATHLIDTLQGQLGVRAPLRPRRRLDREAARKAGTEGRRGFDSNETTLAGPADFARIQYVLSLIGWSQDRLDAFLRSPHSPLNPSNPTIRTLKQANRVYWALKRIATRQGAWQKGRTKWN